MSPVSVGTSHSIRALETGEAKLWILLVGVNQYQDQSLPSLRYSSLDCQGLAEALADATQEFPSKEVIVHHNLAVQIPRLETVHTSLRLIVSEAKSQDTILFYFSGHGILDPNTQQAVLCLLDTYKDDLAGTGLRLQELLQMLGNCAAHQQMVWLDACHSGDMTLRGARGEKGDSSLLNPIPELVKVLRHRAAQSKGFYALLSCDQAQQSWEFPQLGHGVFTYYLMRGLRGEAADPQGVIEADGLYKYVYHQTLQYIDKANQQLRLINQQKRSRGQTELHIEYPLQTPKRIVEGIGELVLGLRPDSVRTLHPRQALVVEGLPGSQTTLVMSKVLREAGGFELEYWPRPGKSWSEVRGAVQSCLRWCPREAATSFPVDQETATVLLYLRGRIEAIEDGEAWIVLGEDNVRLSRSWLRQELRRSEMAQQIVVLDCPGASSLVEWIDDLQLGPEQGQCLMAAASPTEEPELFAQVLLETLMTVDRQVGLAAAEWIAQLQEKLDGTGITLHVWLSGVQGVIDVLPGKIGSVLQELEQLGQSGTIIPASAEAESYPSLVLSPEQSARLEELLTELIGPIAPTLLQQASVHALNPKEVVENLRQQIPLRYQTQFEQQAMALVQKPAIQVQPRSDQLEDLEKLTPAGATTPPLAETELYPCGVLSPEQSARLEELLTELTGPIAPTLLQQASAQALSSKELIQSLMLHLPPHRQAQFKQQAMSLLQAPPAQPQSRSNSLPRLTFQAINQTFVHQCEQDLANLIGPIAAFIIQDALTAHPQISSRAFVETLAAEIPDPQKAIEFCRRLLP